MSEHFLFFVPSDPAFIPLPNVREAAATYITETCGDCHIEHHIEDEVTFWHGGEHFTLPSCPHCDTPLSMENWHVQMDRAFSAQNDLTGITTFFTLTCCDKQANLTTLNNHEVMAFSRYALQCQQTQLLVTLIKDTNHTFLNKLSSLIGTPLLLVWQWV